MSKGKTVENKNVEREFRNAFFEILHYNNCNCFPLSSASKVRTSISKSTHSMNTKYTPPIQSRQPSVIPHCNSSQRNGGCLSCEISPISSKPIQKKTSFLINNDNMDSLEMQMFTHQRKTLEAFYELEHLIPNGVPSRASIVELRSIVQEQDDNIVETPIEKNQD
ncbi:unnamed protein product [Rotaria magnacalcarata]|uniref:Uncharacterized protein n=1 Tax=Rotaria magnacalcarata TaxID=392030 RepID=A0A819KFQ0_9BILA|nr:unnamed protein product [Rotaria magnacalcarata]